MAHESGPKGAGINVSVGSSERAPLIYFDGIATYGIQAGVVQLELGASAVLPEGTSIRTDVLITAHLRCSPAAALTLRDTINRVLEITGTNQTSQQPIPNSKAN